MIDLEFLERLIRAIDQSSLDSIEIERGGTRVRLSKSPPAALPLPPHAPAPTPPPGARAEAAGLHVMVAGIEAGNAASLALHERFGFVRVGRMPEVGRKFDRWLDLVLMQRILAPVR